MRLARRTCLLLAAICAYGQEAESRLTALGNAVRGLELDPQACYRVRDMQLRRDDARLYFNDGWLIFAKPIEGRRVAAVFATGEPGDDAEVTLRPPDQSERRSLAKSTGAPNLSEHFTNAVLVFTDGASDELLAQASAAPSRSDPDMGLVLAGRHQPVARNLAASFQVRLVLDLWNADPKRGLLFAALAGKTLGNFDLLFDPTMQEQIVVGQVSAGPAGPGFDIWSSFQSRASRHRKETVQPGTRVVSYRIQAEIAQDLTLSAVTSAKVQFLERSPGAVAFEIAPAMEVTAVRWNGVPVEVFRRESLRAGLMRGSRNEPFLIIAPQPQEAGSSAEIEFEHKGQVILPAGNDVYYVAARMNWYPSRGMEFATYDLTFRVPKQLSLVATGDLAEEREEGEWHVIRRRTSTPVRVVGFNIGAYEKVSVSRGEYTVEVHANKRVEAALQRRAQQVLVVPGPQVRGVVRRPAEILTMPASTPDPTARLRQIATEVMNDLEWMKAQFGPPPLKRLTVAPIPGFFGQGFPGLIYLATISYLSPADRPASFAGGMQDTFYTDLLATHEVAHQWWGNLVTSATYRDDWLQEALANYTALLLLEKRKGPRALHDVLNSYREGLKGKTSSGQPIESTGPIVWGVRLHAETSPDPWRAIVYDKGSWVLHMLRRRMGDEAFMKMLAALRQRYEFQPVTTEDLRRLAAEFSPQGLPDASLENFFDSWVYSTGIPTLSVTSSVKGKAPALQLQVTVRQTDVPEDFGIDVPVEIRVPGDTKPRVKWIRTSSEPVSFTVPLRRGPAKVELSPGDAVLAFIR